MRHILISLSQFRTCAVPSAALAVVLAGVICFFPAWSFAILLTSILTLFIIIPSLQRRTLASRMIGFFSLLAICEFSKKATFIAPGQALWSQYCLMLLPSVYYILFILPHYLGLVFSGSLSKTHKLVLLFIAVALINTWISTGASPQGKLAATTLLIMPWTLLPLAASYSQAWPGVARTLVGWSLVSALYAFWQFFFGPSTVERNWADAAGDLSIGASHLAGHLESEIFGISIWRITGLQPDSFTFAMFLMTGLTALFLLRVTGKFEARLFLIVGFVLFSAIILSMVRTIWVSCTVAAGFAIFSLRYSIMLRPKILLATVLSFFVCGDILARALYQHPFGAVLTDAPPLIARALTVGTLEARIGAIGAFVSYLPEHLFVGLGYAASPWISGKLGGSSDLALYISKHNVFVELVLYVGLVGLLLFCVVLYGIFHAMANTARQSKGSSLAFVSITAGYLIGMLLSGIGNGGVFLGYFFFFFAGIAAVPLRHDSKDASE